jgi:hypothetical protein
LTDSIIKFDLQSLDCIIKRGLKGETVLLILALKPKTVLSKEGSRTRLYSLIQSQSVDCIIKSGPQE